MIRTETGDGATLAGRPELGTILEFIHLGETLVVTRIDRLARSMRDLQRVGCGKGRNDTLSDLSRSFSPPVFPGQKDMRPSQRRGVREQPGWRRESGALALDDGFTQT